MRRRIHACEWYYSEPGSSYNRAIHVVPVVPASGPVTSTLVPAASSFSHVILLSNASSGRGTCFLFPLHRVLNSPYTVRMITCLTLLLEFSSSRASGRSCQTVLLASKPTPSCLLHFAQLCNRFCLNLDFRSCCLHSSRDNLTLLLRSYSSYDLSQLELMIGQLVREGSLNDCGRCYP